MWIKYFLLGVFFCSSLSFGQTCEQRADYEGRLAYQNVYNRVLADCRGGGGNPQYCRSDFDCAYNQHCINGRCTPMPQTCVPSCHVRWNNGECGTYGRDFCGTNPVCLARCAQRSASTGDCISYATDFCGSMPLSCIPSCVSRWPTGECKTYGQDYCGINPICEPFCQSRWPTGECKEYGADRCRN